MELLSKKRAPYQIKEEDMPVELKKEMKELERFYLTPLNPKREGVPLSSTTLEKMRERCHCFFFYVRTMHSDRKLSLLLCNDADLVFDYIRYLKNNGQLKLSTLSRTISVMLSVVRFNVGIRQLYTTMYQRLFF